jgi:DNA (cytosine-5)-methyltransferase 1
VTDDLAPHPLNIVSLCTGAAGLDLALELAIPNARSVCLVEREAFAVHHLAEAMRQGLLGKCPIWSDARTFRGRPWRGLVDGLIGGIPCQPHSLAGKRGGEDDERDLWSTARRIIVQCRPWFVLIENVEGMLTAADGATPGAERVRRDLQFLGFRVEGGLFTAREVGASHIRPRVFILGVADAASERREGREPGRIDRLGRQPPTERDSGDVVHPQGVGRGEGQSKPVLRSRRHTPSGAERELGNSPGSRLGRGQDAGTGAEYASPHGGGRSQSERTGADVVEPIGGGRDGGPQEPERGSEERAIAERAGERPLFAPGPDDVSSWRNILAGSPELEPAFRRVADGLASRLDIARVDRLRLLGNGVVPLEGAYAIRTLCTRLARRGSAGAAILVRMIGDHDD